MISRWSFCRRMISAELEFTVEPRLVRLAVSPPDPVKHFDGDRAAAGGPDRHPDRLGLVMDGDGPFAHSAAQPSVDDDPSQADPPAAAPMPAIGALVATHSGGASGGGGGGRINVNTAPPEVLRHALRAAGRGGLELVLAARAEGRSVPLGDLRVSSSSSRAAPQIVGSSSAWSFRIDVQVGPLRRSRRVSLFSRTVMPLLDSND